MSPVLYIVLATFFIGSGQVRELTIKCRSWDCVEAIRAHEHESRALTRLRVWKVDEFGLLNVSSMPVWPPIIDDQIQ